MNENVLAALVVGGIVVWVFVIRPWFGNVAQTGAARLVESSGDARRSRNSSRFWIVPAQSQLGELYDIISMAEDLPEGVVLSRATRKGQPAISVEIPPGRPVDSVRGEVLRIARRHDPASAIEIS